MNFSSKATINLTIALRLLRKFLPIVQTLSIIYFSIQYILTGPDIVPIILFALLAIPIWILSIAIFNGLLYALIEGFIELLNNTQIIANNSKASDAKEW